MPLRWTALLLLLVPLRLAADPAPAAAPAHPKAHVKAAPAHHKLTAAEGEASLPEGAPRKLSDLYKFFAKAVSDGLGSEVQANPVRITGRSWELVRAGSFPEVELTLKPFAAQGLKFDKGEFLFRKMEVDTAALLQWKLQMKQVRQVESRLVFTLRSLGKRLSEQAGTDLRLQADMEEQQVLLSGPGAFCGVPCAVEARCQFVWDENAKTLRLAPLEQTFGGRKVPRWLWWAARSPVPQAPVLDFSFSWIPFNIQEVHVGWDQVNLSTNW